MAERVLKNAQPYEPDLIPRGLNERLFVSEASLHFIGLTYNIVYTGDVYETSHQF
jgi:hypothetical protein